MKNQGWKERRPAKRKAALTFGATWYTEENWMRVKAEAADPEQFGDTFAEWAAAAGRSITEFRQTGVNVVKVHIDADELFAWCLAANKPNKAQSRAQFVKERMQAQA
jgi:hypothetical protein